jgi:hypothetical protein
LLQRKCPQCAQAIDYSNSGNFNRAEKAKSRCKVCTGLGRFKPDLVGKRFGNLVVLSKIVPSPKPHVSSWTVRCDCGEEWAVSGGSLRSGGTSRCWTCKTVDSGKKRRRFTDEEKWCPACRGWLPLDRFGVNLARPSGKADRCKVHARADWHASEYNLSPEQYASMRAKQGGRCAICNSDFSLCVDHNHKTGFVRGLLCRRCNMMLGHLNDDVAALERAIQYLQADFAAQE